MLRALLLSAALSGCLAPHRVRIESDPTGTSVRLRQQDLGVTPLEVTLLWWPGRGWFPSTRLGAVGYRASHIAPFHHAGQQIAWDLLFFYIPTEVAPIRFGRARRLIGIEPRQIHHVEMMPKHGRSGTWTPEDAEQQMK